MRVWIKIILKFSFASLLFIGCDGFCEGCGGGGCEYVTGTPIQVAKITSFRLEPDAVVEGDTALYIVSVPDTFKTGYKLAIQIQYSYRNGDQCVDYPGTTYGSFYASQGDDGSESFDYCSFEGDAYHWVTPSVDKDSLITQVVIVLNDSLMALDIVSISDCSDWSYYGPDYASASMLIIDRQDD